MNPKLSIIIVNHNTNQLVYDCLASIKKSKPKVSYEIIVVDNASEKSFKKSKEYRLIENRSNLGFSRASNLGIKASNGKYKLLLNSDTRARSDSLDTLVEFAEKTQDAGVIGAKLLNKDGSLQASVFHFPNIFRAFQEYWLGQKGRFEPYAPDTKESVAVDSVVGAAFLITPKALKSVGLLNEKYFMYFEDLDYCRGVWKKGLKVYYLPSAEVIHHHGASGKNMVKPAFQWRRLIPSSKIYHGFLGHLLVNFVIWSGQKLRRFSPIFIILLSLIPTSYLLVKPGYFYMQDDLQAFRVYEMDRCFDDLQIPCRWVPDAGYQYGYPWFNFYPPTPFYIGTLLHRVGFQYIDSVKILFILGYVLSALAMYLLVSQFLGKWPALVASILYTYAPYKAVEVYVRGAVNEFWALIFFPLLFWASYKIVKLMKLKYVLLFSIFLGLLVTTHALTTMIFLPVLAVWTLSLMFLEKKWKCLPLFILGGLLGIGLSSFYLLPVMFERKYAHLETLLLGYFDYRQHFVNLYRLFISTEWGYGSSGFANEKLNLSTGVPQWILGIFAVFLAFFSIRKKRKLSILALILGTEAILVLFMMHLRSSFIWEKLSFLAWLQFPWRFLTISIFLLSILSALAIYFSAKFRVVLGVLAIVSSILLYIGYFVPKDWFEITDKEKFAGQLWEKQLTISIFDYLPVYAKLPPAAKAPEKPEILDGKAEFLAYRKGSNYQEGEILVKKEATVRLPLFDFPGMKVEEDDKKIEHWNNDCRNQKYCLGLITFKVPEGTHKLKAELANTPIRTLGNTVSLLSFAVLVFLKVRSKKYEKLAF